VDQSRLAGSDRFEITPRLGAEQIDGSRKIGNVSAVCKERTK
jgi:hypothetical protein